MTPIIEMISQSTLYLIVRTSKNDTSTKYFLSSIVRNYNFTSAELQNNFR